DVLGEAGAVEAVRAGGAGDVGLTELVQSHAHQGRAGTVGALLLALALLALLLGAQLLLGPRALLRGGLRDDGGHHGLVDGLSGRRGEQWQTPGQDHTGGQGRGRAGMAFLRSRAHEYLSFSAAYRVS